MTAYREPPPIVIEADVAWLVELIASDLAKGYDGDAAVYREHVHDVIGALIGRGFSATTLRREIEGAGEK
jgi:predicted GNAT superfamily acetyltransferase